MNLDILVLDDEEGYRREIAECLVNAGCRVREAALPSRALTVIGSDKIDIAIVDIRLPEMDGIEVLKKIKVIQPHTEVIMITGHGDMESVINSLRAGASDFLRKPFLVSDIHQSILRTQKYISFREEQGNKPGAYETDAGTDLKAYLIGDSQGMVMLRKTIKKFARSGSDTILITGESGTGKELVARAIHLSGNRSKQMFLPVNTAAIPHELFESSFFGFRKGTFTGAGETRKGYFESADNGTIFLDEIGEMPMDQQVKLLRFIEDKQVMKVGDHELTSVDVRIIAATNKDLMEQVRKERFRNDLYYRLNYLSVNIPPLRDHKEDIPLLFEFFVRQYEKRTNQRYERIEKNVVEALCEYDFPGNVRELKAIIERALIMSEDGQVTLADFHTLPYLCRSGISNPSHTREDLNIGRHEYNLIVKAMQLSGNNKSQAARLLGITRQALDRKLEKHNLN